MRCKHRAQSEFRQFLIPNRPVVRLPASILTRSHVAAFGLVHPGRRPVQLCAVVPPLSQAPRPSSPSRVGQIRRRAILSSKPARAKRRLPFPKGRPQRSSISHRARNATGAPGASKCQRLALPQPAGIGHRDRTARAGDTWSRVRVVLRSPRYLGCFADMESSPCTGLPATVDVFGAQHLQPFQHGPRDRWTMIRGDGSVSVPAT